MFTFAFVTFPVLLGLLVIGVFAWQVWNNYKG